MNLHVIYVDGRTADVPVEPEDSLTVNDKGGAVHLFEGLVDVVSLEFQRVEPEPVGEPNAAPKSPPKKKSPAKKRPKKA